MPSKYLDDIVHEVFLQIYSNPERLKELIDNKQLKYYFIRLCKNNYYSKTSKYYYKYKRQYKDIKPQLERRVIGTLRSTQYSLGGEVELFENNFSSFLEKPVVPITTFFFTD